MNLTNYKAYITLQAVKSGIRAPQLIAENTGVAYKTTLNYLHYYECRGIIRGDGLNRYKITSMGKIVLSIMNELVRIEED